MLLISVFEHHFTTSEVPAMLCISCLKEPCHVDLRHDLILIYVAFLCYIFNKMLFATSFIEKESEVKFLLCKTVYCAEKHGDIFVEFGTKFFTVFQLEDNLFRQHLRKDEKTRYAFHGL